MRGAATPARAQDFTAGAITIEAPWLRATPVGAKVAGGYMTLHNRGPEADRLIGGSSPVAGSIEVHEMHMDGSIMKMRELPDGLKVPAGGSVELKPGSYHLMLIDLKRPLKEGDRIKATLQLAKAGTVEVELAVRGMGSMGDDHRGSKAGSGHRGTRH
jgi:copper(I)-binding protein